jgi:hypothetical protein
MKDEITPEKFIELLRNSDEYIEVIYLNGGCYQFHLILKELFGGEAWIKQANHIATMINNSLYDVTGEIDFESEKEYWIPLSDIGSTEPEKWSFSKKAMLKITECPVCKEPITA